MPKRNSHTKLHKKLKAYKYKNLTLLAFGIILAVILFQNQRFHDFIASLNSFGYISAYFAGGLFVSTFTAAIGTVMLLFLAEDLNPILLAFIGALGCVTGDLLIFRFIRDDGLNNEIKSLLGKKKINRFSRVLHTPYFSWMLPVIGALLIAAPGPDELGISLMGLSKLKTFHFILLSFFLNLISMFAILEVVEWIAR